MRRLRRVLHPTDFSRASGAAFRAAASLAKENRAELLLVHVVLPPTPFIEESFVSPKLYRALEAATRGSAQRESTRRLASTKKITGRARALVLEGVPHDQIVRAARRTHADLIVMGTHGRTGVSKLLLGSVTARVIATASCPVLTVPGKRGQERR